MDDYRAFIHPDVRWSQPVVAPEKNAYQALRQIGTPEDALGATVWKQVGAVRKYTDWEPFRDGEAKPLRHPSSAAARDLIKRTETLADALESAFCGRTLIFPAYAPEKPEPLLFPSKHLVEVLEARARCFGVLGQHEQACAQLILGCRIAHGVLNGGGVYIHYLVGVAVQALALASAERYLRCFHPPDAVLTLLLQGVHPASISDDSLIEAIRAEANLAYIAAVAAYSVRDLVKCHSTASLGGEKALLKAFPLDNPTALDRGETIRLYSEIASLAIARLREPLCKKRQKIHDRQKQISKDVVPPWLASGHRPKESDITAFRESVEKIPNCLGRFLLSEFALIDSDRMSIMRRTRVESFRGVLAIELYRRKEGLYPQSWTEMIRRHLLMDEPLDPASGKSLRLSPKRKKIWGVGADCKDSHGVRGPIPGTSPDYVMDFLA